MGRPRTFDENLALDAAVERFWRHGYLATSVRDLAAEMGISGASLYNAFGSKRALFSRALQRYLDKSPRRRIAELDGSSAPVAALRKFFSDLVKVSVSDRRGCLLVNSAMEIAPHDAMLCVVIRSGLKEIEEGLHRAIRAAQRECAVSEWLDATAVARLLLNTVIAIRVLARTTSDPRVLRGVAKPVLDLLKSGSLAEGRMADA